MQYIIHSSLFYICHLIYFLCWRDPRTLSALGILPTICTYERIITGWSERTDISDKVVGPIAGETFCASLFYFACTILNVPYHIVISSLNRLHDHNDSYIIHIK